MDTKVLKSVKSVRFILAPGLIVLGWAGFAFDGAIADEGGVSLWLPGLYGSLAAVPVQPGWSFATFNYYDAVGANASAHFQRGGGVVAGLDSRVDFQYLYPSYTFTEKVFGGQASLGLASLVGNNSTFVNVTLTGPAGRTISGRRSDTATGIGDLYPNASLRWNQGVNNFMTYVMGDIPVGLYNSKQLANLGIGHAAVDAGGGYTFLDTTTGHEFSAVLGLTYNFFNPMTQYRNGLDSHLDWGASQFLSAQWQLGAVGYVYQQLTGDSGSGDRLGPSKSRVISIGPQIGYFFPVGDMQGYLNLKGYDEFDAKNRASGWNAWLTFSISPKAPTAPVVTNNR